MDMIDNVWKNEEKVFIDNAVDMTLPVRVGHLFRLKILTSITSWRYSLSAPLVRSSYFVIKNYTERRTKASDERFRTQMI